MSKYVKLAAIERMAKSMDELHKEDASSTDAEMSDTEHEGCKCSCCGAPCEVCGEAEDEYSTEDESEDATEADNED